MRTEHSMLEGSLDERAEAYLASLVGENLSETDGGFDLRSRASIGAMMEFGDGASMSFPNGRTAVLTIDGKQFSVGA